MPIRLTEKLCRKLRELQSKLEHLYQLEAAPDVCDFVQLEESTEWETVLISQANSEMLDVAVVLPASIDPDPPLASDGHLQLIEGVSHFLHLSERARTELPTTHLELELQAEVDKFALLAAQAPMSSLHGLHEWLFEQAAFLDPAHTEEGRRYRLANQLAARLWSKLVQRGDDVFTRSLLRRFYRLGQAEKIWLVAAA